MALTEHTVSSIETQKKQENRIKRTVLPRSVLLLRVLQLGKHGGPALLHFCRQAIIGAD